MEGSTSRRPSTVIELSISFITFRTFALVVVGRCDKQSSSLWTSNITVIDIVLIAHRMQNILDASRL